jgi:hypothetical protein
MVILVALLVALFFAAMRAGLEEVGGFLLDLATIKPEVVIILVVFALLWAFFHQRWRFLVWFLGSLFLLVLVGVLFIPAWPLQYWHYMSEHVQSGVWYSPAAAFALWGPGIGDRVGLILTIVLGLLLLWEWWQAWRKLDTNWFLWTSFLTLAVSFLIGIPTNLSSLVVLLMPLIFVFSIFEVRWAQAGRWAVLGSLILLSVLPWWIYWRLNLQQDVEAALALLIFPLPFFMILGLYWVRWWAVRPTRLWIGEMRLMEKKG